MLENNGRIYNKAAEKREKERKMSLTTEWKED